MYFNQKHLFSIFAIVFLILFIIPSSFAANETQNDLSNQELYSGYTDVDLESSEYYFNSSSLNDGDGSYDDPYNELTLSRMKDQSTLCLANGEYTLTDGKTLNDLTIIGENSQNTIIKYVGSENSGVFKINEDSYLNLINITLTGFNLNVFAGNVYASNTIFSNTISSEVEINSSSPVNSGSNSFGGVIYADFDERGYYIYSPEIILDNCTFINNSAEYGGAIYIIHGILQITNSKFITNTAYSYGGAIAALDETKIQINNTLFFNDTSLNDAGGAIYLLFSQLTSNNISFTNCSASYGAAVTSLDSKITLDYITAEYNSVRYDGGAIYQMYNDIYITHSTFNSNSASNGGAIFVDDVNNFKLQSNIFENNTAFYNAGAVYSLLVSRFTESSNSFSNNKANFSDDLYECDEINIQIGNGNYTLIFNNSTSESFLPVYFNLADYGGVTPIKNQENGGNCWAFASIAALESAILKATGISLDLSEENMKNLIEMFSDYGWDMETNDGGYDEMAIGYLTSWLGPVLEEQDEYDDYSMLSAVFNSYTHIQNIIYLTRNSYTDNDAIKEAIMKYGAVCSGIYYDDDYFSEEENSYYCNIRYPTTNHGIAIVGWNDTYSRTNFLNKPSGDGAWICKNSWDDDWGDNGYFYVSYYDTSVIRIDYPCEAYVFVFNDTDRFDKNYQYDIIGQTDYYSSGYSTLWVENIFESTDDELLAGVSTYFRQATDYELYIYVNDELIHNQNGTCNPGYTTINLNRYILLNSGDMFKVMFKLSCEEGVEFAVSEAKYANKLIFSSGVSFYSSDGVNWNDLYTTKLTDLSKPLVASIKAFTKLYEYCPHVELNTSFNNNIVNFEGFIYDSQYNLTYNGNIIVTVEGIDYNLVLNNSKFNFTHEFTSIGNHTINLLFKDYNMTESVNVQKLFVPVNMSFSIINHEVVLNFKTLPDIITQCNITVNNKTYQINLSDGASSLVLDDDSQYYEISALISDEIYVGGYENRFFKTKITADTFTVPYDMSNYYSIQLTDCFNNVLSNRQVLFYAGKSIYNATTDDNGFATVLITLDNRNDTSMSVLYNGSDSYIACNSSVNIKIKSSISFLSTDYLTGSNYTVILFDGKNTPLTNTQFNIIINGISYWYVTDNQGKLTMPLKLSPGIYNVHIKNHITGEEAYQNITLVSKIMENKNMNVYYLSGSTYNLKIYGENATSVGAGKLVQIIINKKTYFIKTNNNGYASFKISLKPGTYKITAVYEDMKVSNKIIVKPLLTAKNVSTKKSGKVKFQAKLVNTKGKVQKSKKITFKIKGKKYTAKTNSKGIATIYIKNLKKGKYTIVTKYGKSQIKNIIKIKR